MYYTKDLRKWLKVTLAPTARPPVDPTSWILVEPTSWILADPSPWIPLDPSAWVSVLSVLCMHKTTEKKKQYVLESWNVSYQHFDWEWSWTIHFILFKLDLDTVEIWILYIQRKHVRTIHLYWENLKWF